MPARSRRLAGLLLLLLAAAVSPAAAQDSPSPPAASADTTLQARTVGTIRVQGNVAVDTLRILRTFEVSPGASFSLEAIQRGIRKLFALGLFRDAWVEQIPSGDRVDLVVHVIERPRIASIAFSGNQRRETSELEKKLFLRVNEPYSRPAVQTQVDTLLRFYRDEGFARAAIEAKIDSVPGQNQVRLTFQVQEGERVRITRIEFRGNTAFPGKRLRKQLATKQKGLFGGGDIKDETFAEDVEKLTAWYRNHGYRDVQVTGHELVAGKRPRDLTLVFTVSEGRLYHVGQVEWTGNQVLTDATLARIWTPKPGERYDFSRIQRAQAEAYSEYAEKGYLYVGIEPRENVRDSLVDVAFTLQEGAPSHVRYVQVQGNQATREKVIRRELDLHPGNLFKRSALVRSQGDLMRLGLFEEVIPDIVPAESTDVDVQFKVKEKQVGTASAGAGYTAEGGLTGFLELGHNNVLGNGQSLSLHLERGANREDYYLSFTEPWFRDTPTLLGFSVFNTNRDRDISGVSADYEEKRRGGSVRIGRPLPWPDYSRGSISYRLEDVVIEIDKPESEYTPQDSIVLRGLKSGEPTRTSSINAYFLRNSTDNPFYPTQGSRFSSESELAGGPFGGSVNFHKHRVEARAYLPSILKGVTTMLRARVGLLGEYADQNSSVPPYERFRMGGGTTPDPLRGYDDYMVVPEKFIREVLTPTNEIDHIDSLTTPGERDTVYRTTSSILRYPGGRFLTLLTIEQQFPIAHPLHGVVFFDAGNVWDLVQEARPLDLKLGAGVGLRLEIPLLGNIGFDFGYGFHRGDLRDRPRWVGHFLLGQTSF